MTKIHIFGASGSGTTTLGGNLARNLAIRHFDSDNYYWKKTNPPFTDKNEVSVRQRLLLNDLNSANRWVLSGSLDSWSEPFLPLFQLVVFLWLPCEIRLRRLKLRERGRYGSKIDPGGEQHESYMTFMDWAAHYDDGSMTGRSKPCHEEWIKTLPCPVLRIEGEMSEEESTQMVVAKLLELGFVNA